ncbi:MAG: hypothetical protein ACI9VR_000577 [Cognaticolwellia sp.]|jgi:hypothetical protein
MFPLALLLSTSAFAQEAPQDGSTPDTSSEDGALEGTWGTPEEAAAPAPVAAPVAAPAPAPVAAPVVVAPPPRVSVPVVDPKLDAPEEWPIYVSARGALAVPANGLGQIKVGGLGVGVELDNGHTFGMRAIYMDSPPKNPISNNREVAWAWGPVLDYQFHLDNDRRLNFYPSMALGFVYSAEKDMENVILPIFEVGFGARLVKKTSNGDRLFIQPELGVVPGALAPYTSLTVGMMFGAKED